MRLCLTVDFVRLPYGASLAALPHAVRSANTRRAFQHSHGVHKIVTHGGTDHAFGHELVEIVADEGQSAKSLDRPGMQRILQMVDRKQVDGVVAAKLDRLTRSTRDLLDTIERCERRKVALASVSESQIGRAHV